MLQSQWIEMRWAEAEQNWSVKQHCLWCCCVHLWSPGPSIFWICAITWMILSCNKVLFDSTQIALFHTFHTTVFSTFLLLRLHSHPTLSLQMTGFDSIYFSFLSSDRSAISREARRYGRVDDIWLYTRKEKGECASNHCFHSPAMQPL